jgi:hypothetical protein
MKFMINFQSFIVFIEFQPIIILFIIIILILNLKIKYFIVIIHQFFTKVFKASFYFHFAFH